jgi:single-strand DNA-binding protein
MIKLQLIGNLGKDCVVNSVNGKQVINFSVAHTEKFKDAQGVSQQKTTWVSCNYWSDSKVSQYLKQGTLVYVEGTPQVRTYEGQRGTQAELSLRIHQIQLLGGNKDQRDGQQSSSAVPDNTGFGGDTSQPVDDLPF